MHYQEGIDRDQLQMLSLSSTIADDAFVRIIDLLVDAMPLEDLGFTNSKLNKEGNIPYHPADMLKLWMYGYRYGMRSGSKLAKACVVNLEVMWFIKGLRPSPRTINYFRSNNAEAIIATNKHFVQLLRKWKKIGSKLLAVDSTKIRAQNSLKNNFNQKKINRHLEYLEEKMERINKELDEEHLKNQHKNNYTDQEMILSGDIEKAHDRLEYYKEMEKHVNESEDGQVSVSDPDSKAVNDLS